MTKTQAQSKATSRVYPMGTFVKFADSTFFFSDGVEVPLSDVLDGTLDVDITQVVRELCDELLLLRKILKETARQRGMRIGYNNDFHREMESMAGKLGEHPDDLKAIVEPMVRELVSDMFTPKKGKQRGRRR